MVMVNVDVPTATGGLHIATDQMQPVPDEITCKPVAREGHRGQDRPRVRYRIKRLDRTVCAEQAIGVHFATCNVSICF
jgi:hypothetical protein